MKAEYLKPFFPLHFLIVQKKKPIFDKKNINMRVSLFLMLYFVSLNLFSQFNFEVFDINQNEDPYVQKYTIFNDMLFFAAIDEIYDYELWISDGTQEGTKLLKDINPDSYSDPDYLTVFNNKLFFSADDGIHGKELWCTDGTSEGTSLFVDINKTGASEPRYLMVCDDKLFFSADDGEHGTELWVSDGTPENTYMVKDINNTGSAKPVSFMQLNGKLLFWANEIGVNNERLWITDGTNNGTFLLKNIKKLDFMKYEKFVLFENKLYFGAEDSLNGRELWCSDGTPIGTYMVKDINPNQTSWGGGSSFPDYFYVFNDKIYFSANDGEHSEELWVSDGTTEGTVLFKDINPFGLSNPTNFYEYNGYMFFGADDGIHGKELWVSNGTTSGTYMLIDINSFSDSSPTLFTLSSGMLFFRGSVFESGEIYQKLFVSDGTADGTYYINPQNSTNPEPLETTYEFCAYKNKLFLNAAFTSSVRKLWSVADTTNVKILESGKEQALNVYPNPTKNKIEVRLNHEFSNLEIRDFKGELIFNFCNNSKLIEIDLADKKNGIYFLIVRGDNVKTIIRKIIKIG